jgi:hypothetical protein
MSEVVFAIESDPTMAAVLPNEDAEALARHLEIGGNPRDIALCDKIRQRAKLGQAIDLHRDELVAIAELFAQAPPCSVSRCSPPHSAG